MDACLGGRTIRDQVAHQRVARRRHLRIMHHEQPGEQHHGQDNVGGRTREGDQQALPARFRIKAAWIGVLIVAVFARHLHIAAEKKQQRKAEIGFAALEAE